VLEGTWTETTAAAAAAEEEEEEEEEGGERTEDPIPTEGGQIERSVSF
jgi:hypothetical protein